MNPIGTRAAACPFLLSKRFIIIKERYPVDKTVQTGREIPDSGMKKNALLDRITAYVEENLTEKITLERIASHFGVSVSSVTQLFQKKSQTTFHHFLTDRRMEMARTLILQGEPLESVGKQVGYQDHSTFYRAFRQTFGISPREYRKTVFREEKE